MEYKESQYNLLIPIDEGKTLAYSTLWGTMSVLDEEYMSQLLAPEPLPENDFTIKLANQHFVVPVDADELDIIQKKKTDEINSRSETISLVIAPTLACNYKCIFCFEKNIERGCNVMNEAVQAQTIEYVHTLIASYPMAKRISVVWFGGEPTLCMDTIKNLSSRLITLANDNGLGYKAKVITNGSSLSKEVINDFLAIGVTSIQLTLNGDKKYHCLYTKCSEKQFDMLLESIIHASSVMQTNVRCNLSVENANSLISVIKTIASNISSSRSKLSFYCEPIENYGNTEIRNCTAMNRKNFNDCRARLSSLLESLNLKNERMSGYPRHSMTNCQACSPSFSVIGPDGTLYQCDLCLGHENFSVGNVYDGKTHISMIKTFVDFALPYKQCSTCNLLPVCAGGCTGQRVLYGKKVDCKMKRKQIIEGVIKKYRDYQNRKVK